MHLWKLWFLRNFIDFCSHANANASVESIVCVWLKNLIWNNIFGAWTPSNLILLLFFEFVWKIQGCGFTIHLLAFHCFTKLNTENVFEYEEYIFQSIVNRIRLIPDNKFFFLIISIDWTLNIVHAHVKHYILINFSSSIHSHLFAHLNMHVNIFQ